MTAGGQAVENGDGRDNDAGLTNDPTTTTTTNDEGGETTNAASTPKMTRKTAESSSQEQSKSTSMKKTTTTTKESMETKKTCTLTMLKRQNAIKVIKGEIHNVLTVMRTDVRYASPIRFVDEVLEDHPLLGSLRDLHQQLSVWNLSEELSVALYLNPFCAAISGRDISASVTGSALSALHKLVLYGFMEGSQEGMTLIAKSLLHCTFEESTHGGGGDKRRPSLMSSSSSSTPSSSSSVAAVGLSTRTGLGIHNNDNDDDEQVVLKLVSLAALLVSKCVVHRGTKQEEEGLLLLDTTLVVGLLDTCLHVSHRARHASGLLRSAATDALAQIVLVVFSCNLPQARATILAQLASLVNPTAHHHYHHSSSSSYNHYYNNNHNKRMLSSADACATALTLINIALETMESAHPAEVHILHNELCKHLLQWSTTQDLVVLSLTLRVIFNLFQSMRNHMKVPLEIFITSVHLRILDKHGPTSTSTNTTTNNNNHSNNHNNNTPHNRFLGSIVSDQREVALESLLEFCQEPSLLQDIYLNYDCDMNCTNLFETICHALCVTTIPDGGSNSGGVNALHKLALEGLLAIVDSIARKCGGEGGSLSGHKQFTNHPNGPKQQQPPPKQQPPLQDEPPSNGSVSDLSEDGVATATAGGGGGEEAMGTETGSSDGLMQGSYDDLGARWQAEETHKVLQERKRQKHVVHQVAMEFNRHNPDWIRVGQDMELFPTHLTPATVAQFLYNSNGGLLDKTQMGLYLSKGPTDLYPFQGQVRTAFCALFDFTDLSFADALRTFLSKFRLPGEAQCIDRLMEAFSTELYQQQRERQEGSRRGPLVLEPEDGDDEQEQQDSKEPLFRSADSVFRMAFSTIMLNTDLHNPGVKDERRMTLEQFIRNNRGLNDDQDFPRPFLQDLYHKIQTQELEVDTGFLQVLQRHDSHQEEISSNHWEKILKRRIAEPFFTPAEAAHSRLYKAGVHDRDMFVIVAKKLTEAISSVFVKSTDDVLVLKTLRGFQQMAKICVYFDLDETFNDILQIQLGHGRDYIMSCIALEYAGYDSGHIMAAGPAGIDGHDSLTTDDFVDSPPPVIVGGSDGSGNAPSSMPVPQDFLTRSLSFSQNRMTRESAQGSAAHRGLLALDCGFTLIRTQPSRMREAWPTLIECLCALRDARALPERVIFLDDFADSRGNLLPLSPFAKQSQRRLDEYYRSLSNAGSAKRKSWFASLMSTMGDSSSGKMGPTTDASTAATSDGTTLGTTSDGPGGEKELSYFSRALLQVTKRAKLEQVVLMRPKNLPLAKQTVRALLDAIDAYPYFDDPIFEQHAVYSLELALLALISNRDRVTELYPLFLAKFDAVLHGGNSEEVDTSEKNLPTPFLMERVVVSILRSCIHLYDAKAIRPQLRTSLHLLMDLPQKFKRYVSDRIACGMAIFLSQKFSLLESNNEWSFVGDILDSLAHFGPGRGFVFDGIANTVESQLTPTSQAGDTRPTLSLDGSSVLAKLLLKFVFGTYQKDMTLSIPAMLCLENLYRHTILLRLEEGEGEGEVDVNNNASSSSFSVEGNALVSYVPDKDLWQKIAVSFYSVCRSPDPAASRQGTDCFQRFIASTKMDSLPDDTWLTMLHLIVMKQPPVTSQVARINCCAILGKVLLMTIAHLSESRDNWEDLTDIVNQMAVLTGENLREGRRGAVSPLFESTLQSITFLSNHMVSEEFTGEKEYGTWVSDTLLSELEKVGAGGGSVKNVAATTKQSTESRKPGVDMVPNAAIDDDDNKDKNTAGVVAETTKDPPAAVENGETAAEVVVDQVEQPQQQTQIEANTETDKQ